MTWTGIRTIMVLELRQRVRATRWRVMLGIWLAVLILLCGGLTIAAAATSSEPSKEFFVPLYDLVVCFVLGIGLIVAPTLSATSINGDRTDATLALLQATALRSQEIVVGKLLAAWVAAIAFLATAAPFLIILTVAGGSHWQAVVAHLVILVFTLGAVCAIGLGFSALTARPSASAVLTYIVVAALTVGTPLATTIASPLVTSTQTEVTYSVALGDATAHVPPQPAGKDLDYSTSLLTITGRWVDGMRDPQPERVVYNYCKDREDSYDGPSSTSNRGDAKTKHIAFWPASLVALVTLGAGGVITASRRLRVPAGKLPRGVRLA